MVYLREYAHLLPIHIDLGMVSSMVHMTPKEARAFISSSTTIWSEHGVGVGLLKTGRTGQVTLGKSNCFMPTLDLC